MRSRFMNRMSHQEVENYLQRNDIIFVALGTTEVHGHYPVNVETKVAEALALLCAEKVDGLVLSDLPYFFVGASPMSPATVKMSVHDGYHYLKEIAHSLLAQGFRRQVYISLHGPAFLTAGSMVVDFFDETKVPISYIDGINIMNFVKEKCGIEPKSEEDIMLGAYEILDIKDQLIVDPDIEWEVKEAEKTETVLDKWDYMRRFAHGSGSVGFYFVKPYDHAGMTGAFKTVAERDAACKQGGEYMRALIDNMELPEYMAALREIDEQTEDTILPKFGRLLPDNRYPYRPRKK